jgi:pyruvate kinase
LRKELAFELEPEKLMVAQKWMIQTANLASIPVFLQSQVLESMMTNNIIDARQ